MINATPEHREKIIEILQLSFEDNKSVSYICGNNGNRSERIRQLMEYAYKVCNRFGKVYVSEDGNACALALLPDLKATSIKSLIWDVELALRVIGLSNVFKVLKREALIKKHHPTYPFYYLWFIGTHPSHKGLGIGSKLLKEILEDAEKMNRPVYLETSTLKNLPWYKRFGFNIYGEMYFGYQLFMLSNVPMNR